MKKDDAQSGSGSFSFPASGSSDHEKGSDRRGVKRKQSDKSSLSKDSTNEYTPNDSIGDLLAAVLEVVEAAKKLKADDSSPSILSQCKGLAAKVGSYAGEVSEPSILLLKEISELELRTAKLLSISPLDMKEAFCNFIRVTRLFRVSINKCICPEIVDTRALPCQWGELVKLNIVISMQLQEDSVISSDVSTDARNPEVESATHAQIPEAESSSGARKREVEKLLRTLVDNQNTEVERIMKLFHNCTISTNAVHDAVTAITTINDQILDLAPHLKARFLSKLLEMYAVVSNLYLCTLQA